MSVHEPTHARAATLSLFVHEPNELGILRDEVDMGADACTKARQRVVGVRRVYGLEGGRLESASNLEEGLVDCGLPKLEFVSEVVTEETERHVGPGGDLARGRSVESLLRECLECRIEDAVAHFDRAAGQIPTCSHRSYSCTTEQLAPSWAGAPRFWIDVERCQKRSVAASLLAGPVIADPRLCLGVDREA